MREEFDTLLGKKIFVPKNLKQTDYCAPPLSSFKIQKSALIKLFFMAKAVSNVFHSAYEVYALCIGKDFLIEDIYIPFQNVTHVSINIQGDKVYEARKEIREQKLTIIGWAHSHADFSVFSSGTDNENHRTILHETFNYTELNGIRLKYMVAMTVNMREDVYGVMLTHFPCGTIKQMESGVEVVDDIFDMSEDNLKRIYSEIHTKVSQRVSIGGYYSSYNSNVTSIYEDPKPIQSNPTEKNNLNLNSRSNSDQKHSIGGRFSDELDTPPNQIIPEFEKTELKDFYDWRLQKKIEKVYYPGYLRHSRFKMDISEGNKEKKHVNEKISETSPSRLKVVGKNMSPPTESNNEENPNVSDSAISTINPEILKKYTKKRLNYQETVESKSDIESPESDNKIQSGSKISEESGELLKENEDILEKQEESHKKDSKYYSERIFDFMFANGRSINKKYMIPEDDLRMILKDFVSKMY